jgi:hypothetical protein
LVFDSRCYLCRRLAFLFRIAHDFGDCFVFRVRSTCLGGILELDASRRPWPGFSDIHWNEGVEAICVGDVISRRHLGFYHLSGGVFVFMETSKGACPTDVTKLNVNVALRSTTEIIDELVADLATSPTGRCERVIDEFSGRITIGTGTGDSADARPIHDRADAMIEELRKSWGPTADPHWVDKLLADRESDGIEHDCLFALFRRKGVWGYVRMRALEEETLENARLRLILGVVKAAE